MCTCVCRRTQLVHWFQTEGSPEREMSRGCRTAMNKQGAPSDLKSAITALRLRQPSPSLGEKKRLFGEPSRGKHSSPSQGPEGKNQKRPPWWSEVRGALVFSPGLVHMLETMIPFHALFISAENRKQLCRDGSRGPIRSRTMAQATGNSKGEGRG